MFSHSLKRSGKKDSGPSCVGMRLVSQSVAVLPRLAILCVCVCVYVDISMPSFMD